MVKQQRDIAQNALAVAHKEKEEALRARSDMKGSLEKVKAELAKQLDKEKEEALSARSDMERSLAAAREETAELAKQLDECKLALLDKEKALERSLADAHASSEEALRARSDMEKSLADAEAALAVKEVARCTAETQREDAEKQLGTFQKIHGYFKSLPKLTQENKELRQQLAGSHKENKRLQGLATGVINIVRHELRQQPDILAKRVDETIAPALNANTEQLNHLRTAERSERQHANAVANTYRMRFVVILFVALVQLAFILLVFWFWSFPVSRIYLRGVREEVRLRNPPGSWLIEWCLYLFIGDEGTNGGTGDIPVPEQHTPVPERRWRFFTVALVNPDQLLHIWRRHRSTAAAAWAPSTSWAQRTEALFKNEQGDSCVVATYAQSSEGRPVIEMLAIIDHKRVQNFFIGDDSPGSGGNYFVGDGDSHTSEIRSEHSWLGL